MHLISEILCENKLFGRKISKKIKIVAACNPFKERNRNILEDDF